MTTRAALAALLALPCLAFAQVQAFTNQPVDLMAGPDSDYPVVASLAPNQPVTVMGCVSSYEWCDVVLDDLRGWIYGGALTYPYQGTYVPLQSYGAIIGLPVVVFSFDSYWGRYYHDRPWYGDRDRWRRDGPHGNEPRPYQPPMQGQGQPVYRPQTSPLPPRGPQSQPQSQPQQMGRPFQPQAPQQQQPQHAGGQPFQPVQPPPQARPQPQPQQMARPPVQGQPQQPGGQPFQPVQPPPQARPQPQPQQMARPPVQGQPQQPGGQPFQPRPQPQPQAQPQSHAVPNQGHREPQPGQQ
jgi:uncharacterized protein YraI